MRRITGAALFGLGILCLLFAMALAWIIVPSQRKVPLDLVPPDVAVEAADASFVQAKLLPNGTPQVVVENAGLRSVTGIKPDFAAAGGLDGETLVWNVYHSTRRADTNEVINSAESRVALDRSTGEAVPWEGQCHVEEKAPCVPGSVTFSGHLYLFPFGTGKTTYRYWDSTLGTALPLEYQAEEEFNNLPTYRFQQVVPEQPAAMDPESLSGLLSFLAPGATSGTISYRATRTLWIEPQTGAIVGYREQQHRELVPDTGARVVIFDAALGRQAAPEPGDVVEAERGGARATQDDRHRVRLAGHRRHETVPVLGYRRLVPALAQPDTAGKGFRRRGGADRQVVDGRAVPGRRRIALRLPDRRPALPVADPAAEVRRVHEQQARRSRDQPAERGDHRPAQPVGQPLAGQRPGLRVRAADHQPDAPAAAVQRGGHRVPHVERQLVVQIEDDDVVVGVARHRQRHRPGLRADLLAGVQHQGAADGMPRDHG
ncbi:porin PorA family protein [Actinoplanes philippinensis]|uniref:porin PorA family protein n=1 Tax=Actinoplanes philippinensis TaxID=35752 RepID=UPI0033E5FFFF